MSEQLNLIDGSIDEVGGVVADLKSIVIWYLTSQFFQSLPEFFSDLNLVCTWLRPHGHGNHGNTVTFQDRPLIGRTKADASNIGEANDAVLISA